MPVATSDLTTLASVREYLGIQTADSDSDALIQTYITSCSRAIMKWAGREFAPQVTATIRKFRYEGGGRLAFSPFDLVTATLVTIDSDGTSPTTLVANEDYYLLPLNGEGALYTSMELRNLGPATRSSSTDYTPWRQVSITGTWGLATATVMTTFPDVALAANVQVAFMMRNHSARPGGDEFGGDSSTYGPVGLCQGTRDLLRQYRIVEF